MTGDFKEKGKIMREEYYNPHGNTGLIIRFRCKQCSYWIKSDEIAIPLPDFSSEDISDSYVHNDDTIVCNECDAEYKITVSASQTDGYFEIDELDGNSKIEIEEISKLYDFNLYDAIATNKQFYTNFKLEIDKLVRLNGIDLDDVDLNTILKRQIFIGTITVLETFLSDTLINMTLANKNYLQSFVETYSDFQKEKISYGAIYKEFAKIENKIKDTMTSILYHNLDKIKVIYEKTFTIKFPEMDNLKGEVTKRHDLVHRGGKNKDGDYLNITSESNNMVIGYTKVFVDDLANKLNLIDDLF